MKLHHALAGALALACLSTPAMASDPLADFFGSIFSPPQEARLHPSNRGWRRVRSEPVRADGGVASMIAHYVSERIGSQWVQTALQIARIESGGRCTARNRDALGVFQVRNPERFGVSRSSALTCAGGVAAGVAHMETCLAKGARTGAQMMRCHNSGSPNGRVERAYRRFVRG